MNREALFCDGTGDYVIPAEPEINEKVVLRFRTAHNDVDEVKLHHKVPLIVEIPDRHGTGRKPDFITSYVNEAIGLKL